MIGALFGGGGSDLDLSPIEIERISPVFLEDAEPITTGQYYYGEGAPTDAMLAQLRGTQLTRQQINNLPRQMQRRLARSRRATRRDAQRGERIARQSTAPYRYAGRAAVDNMRRLSSPSAQRDYIQRNPFYGALRDDAARTLFANEAARGKVGSGGTAKALDNAFALLGENLVQNQFGRLNTLAGLGQQANQMLQGTTDRSMALRNQADLRRLGIDTDAVQRRRYTLADLNAGIGDIWASGIMGEAGTGIARDQADLQAQLYNNAIQQQINRFNAIAQQQADVANQQAAFAEAQANRQAELAEAQANRRSGGGLGSLLGPIMKIAGGAFGGGASPLSLAFPSGTPF